jgi:lipopolysaccharide/colanic/teichoic acid biosynthesis glycosyltransferase
MLKRAFDLFVSLLLLLPAIFICVIASIIIYLDVRANPLFVQWRIGRNRRPFLLYKLRTMLPQTPDGPSHQVGTATISRTGAILRLLKIDELPQLLCVLKGDMSLVGPRPCLGSQLELISEREKRNVFSVRPGITGLAQIKGLDMSTPIDLAIVDAAYINDATFRADLLILLRTIIGDGVGDAAS